MARLAQVKIPIGFESDEEQGDSWLVWLAIIAITLLLHLLFFMFKPSLYPHIQPAPVEIQKIDPQKLDTIRKQWKARERQLLISKGQTASKEAPPDARYMSDRNIKVEKEQRARQTNVIPKSASPAQPMPPREKPQPKSRAQPVPKLGNLGIPFKLDSKPVEETPIPPQNQSQNPAQEGGDQALLDKKLPEGSENMLNAQESVYYSFYARIYEAIAPIWQSRIREIPRRRTVPQGEYQTLVDVVLDQQGILLEVRHVHDSGITDFDNAVDTSWKKIGRFPNPPKGLLDAQGRVHLGWTFTVSVGPGFNMEYLPPERNY